MTQRARKGKLYQLQYLIDLSCFIIAHMLVFGCSPTFGSTQLIYFANTCHKADNPAGTHRFAKQTPFSIATLAPARFAMNCLAIQKLIIRWRKLWRPKSGS